jgi:putative multiple sugar transport system ATP-binding protein
MYVRKGEVVGIYGLMGAGRTELAMSIFGQSYGTNITGELKIDGKPVKMKKSASDAIKHKIAYVTEDRKGNGLVLSQSIKVNTSLAHLDAISNHMVIDGDKEYAVAEEYRKPAEGPAGQMDVRGAGHHAAGRTDPRYRRRRQV